MESGVSRGPSKYSGYTTASSIVENLDLRGRTYAVTGTTSGIGRSTIEALLKAGARTVAFNRDFAASETQKEELLQKYPNAKIDVIVCNLDSLASVRSAAENFMLLNQTLSGIILNAGVYKPALPTTVDGYEATFAINHLAHYYLTKLLLGALLASDSPSKRIVVVASESHALTGLERSAISAEDKVNMLTSPTEFVSRLPVYGEKRLYEYSKLCNVLFAFKLASKLAPAGVTVNALHPGSWIQTSITRNTWLGQLMFTLSKPFTKSLDQGAATTVFAAVSPDIQDVTGKYLQDCAVAERQLAPIANETELQDRLWRQTDEMIAAFEQASNLPTTEWKFIL